MRISNSFRMVITLAMFLSVFIQSCGFFRREVALTEVVKNEIKNRALAYVQYYIDGNVESIMTAFAENVTDIGGGPDLNGSIIDLRTIKVELERKFNSESFKSKYSGKVLSDVLVIDSILAYSYKEIMADVKLNPEAFGFTVQPNDYLIRILPTLNSPMHDGFYAFYRKIKGEWLIIATS